MCISENFIRLCYSLPVEEWFISYNRDGAYFIIENSDNNKITKLKNVESFIRIWNDRKRILDCNAFRNDERGSISIFIGNKYHSGFACTDIYILQDSDIIQDYINILKDIVEEKDGKLVSQVENVVGDYVEKDDKVTGEQVGDYDIL